MTQKEIIVKAYMDGIGHTILEEMYSLNPGAVKRFAKAAIGDTYHIQRKVNLRKRMARMYGYTYWAFEFVEEE